MGGKTYQDEAREIVDYNLFQVPGSDEWFRGPEFSRESCEYITFIGAAQTFGTFVRYPFPAILSERLPRPTLNLGIGGAGPGRFLQDPALIDHANKGVFTVVQVMSGRSAENSEFELLDGCSSMRRRGSKDRAVLAEVIWAQIIKERPQADLKRLIRETQEDWVNKMRALLDRISTPKALVWISRRRPGAYPSDAAAALKEFPHFVTRKMVDQIKSRVDVFVDATSARGSPQALSSRFTGMPIGHVRSDTFVFQSGYPSPEMHEDIANALFPALHDMLPKLWRKFDV